MNITFRTDASLQIGTGHVMRCLTLAHALQNAGARCRFITRVLPGNLADRIATEGFEVTLLAAPDGPSPDGPPDHAAWSGVDWSQDAAETSAALGKRTEWLVVDHYAFDARWEGVACPAGTRLMVIDDLADRPHDCDILLDQNLGRVASDYNGLVPDRCARLIGPRYALLRPEFADMRPAALADRLGRKPQNLLITMGGVDPFDVTSRVLHALREADLPSGMSISVIMGANAPALEQVRTLAKGMAYSTEVLVDVTDMAARMANADLSIGAAGSTTWERCALGLPTIIVQIADNQTGISQAVSAAGASLDPGPFNAPEFALNLQTALTEVIGSGQLTVVAQQAAEICDGDGTARVALALCSPNVHFRDAKSSDSRRIWEWRRAMDVSFSMMGNDTPFDRHDLWFRQALDSSERFFRIMMMGNLACGYLRLDQENNGCARVSICLSPDIRGRGLSHRLLEEAGRLGACHGITRLNAEIHPLNRASRRVFDRGGYIQSGTINEFLTFQRMLEEVS